VTAAALAGLALATLVSEDLTTIGAASLAREGYLDLWPAIAACAAGVYLGDLGLWFLGRRLGMRVLRLPWVRSRVDQPTLLWAAARIDQHLSAAVLASRFLPGTRLPVYLAAGALGRRPLAFAVWSFVAVALWTPLLAAAAIWAGAAVAALALERAATTIARLLAAWAMLAAVRLVARRRRAAGVSCAVTASTSRSMSASVFKR
jgi:membrane protein DedA with SNARE-associated domain